jgi:hypothetical protein
MEASQSMIDEQRTVALMLGLQNEPLPELQALDVWRLLQMTERSNEGLYLLVP